MSNFLWVLPVYVLVLSCLRATFIGKPQIDALNQSIENVAARWSQSDRGATPLSLRIKPFAIAKWFLPGGGEVAARWRALHEFDQAELIKAGVEVDVLKVRRLELIGQLTGRTDPTAKFFADRLAASGSATDIAAAQRFVDECSDRAYERAGRTHQMAFLLLVLLTCALWAMLSTEGFMQVAFVGAAGGLLSFGLRLLKGGARSGGDNGLQWSRLLLAPTIGAASSVLGLMLVAGLVPTGTIGSSLKQVCTDVGYAEAACTATTDATHEASHEATDDATKEAATEQASVKKEEPTSPLTGLGPTTMALAIALAFSERFFQRWISAAEERFNPDGAQSDGDAPTVEVAAANVVEAANTLTVAPTQQLAVAFNIVVTRAPGQ
jgi:hypothetical protein